MRHVFCILLISVCVILFVHCKYIENEEQTIEIRRFAEAERIEEERKEKEYVYGLMLDAGSSGTRLHVYLWPPRSSDTIPQVQSAPIGEVPYTMKVRPGISSYANNPSDAGASLEPLIQFAMEKVPKLQHRLTTIYLKATAGMRLLDVPTQQAILDSCRETLSASPFFFLPQWAEVISGQEEGVYGWVTVNYLSNSLSNPSTNSSFTPSTTAAQRTNGALDLGGASTQITFATDENLPEGYAIELKLSGTTYNLYTYSFLGYGNDQARFKKNQTIVVKNGYKPITKDGCLPIGKNSTFQVGDESDYFTITGDSSFLQCYAESFAVLDKTKHCPIKPCSFDGVYQPPLPTSMNFFAFSGYYYMRNFFKLPAHSSIAQIALAGVPFCALDVDELKEKYHDDPNYPFIDTYCFLNAYVCTLLHSGFGFSMLSEQIEFVEELNDVEVGWTLGAMIYEADLLPWAFPEPKPSSSSPSSSPSLSRSIYDAKSRRSTPFQRSKHFPKY